MLTTTPHLSYADYAAVNSAVEFRSSFVKADNRFLCGIFSSVDRLHPMVAPNGGYYTHRILNSGLLTRSVPPTLLEGGNGKLNAVKEITMTNQSTGTPVSIPPFEATITKQQILSIDAATQRPRTRQSMLCILAMSSAELVDLYCSDDGSMLLETIDAIKDYDECLKSISELSQCALSRLYYTAELILNSHAGE